MKENRHIFLLLLLAASCTSNLDVEKDFVLSPDGQKTPINVVTNLTTGSEVATKAVNKKFEENDQLLAYIQTVTVSGDPVTYTEGTFKGLKTFALTADADNTAGGTNITATSALSPTIYWDDYSSTSYDLRDANKYLRLLYGYCYNGGTPTTELNYEAAETAGTLGWTVATDQSAGFKTSDLLWANTQTPVHYTHGATPGSDHGTLTLPYTHAMSKMTIRLQLGAGYSSADENFSGNVVTLKSKNTVASLTAPSASITGSSAADIIMHLESENTANIDYSYAAVFAPTTLAADAVLATISSIHGNGYTVTVTSDMLSSWGSKLTTGTTWSGVNYVLTVSITKQQITVSATLEDWDAVGATGTGVIQFANDVTTEGTIAAGLQTGGFDVFKLQTGGTTTNADYGTKATELSYNTSTSEWEYAPVIYWPNGTDQFYFRAVSPVDAYSSGNIDWSRTTEDVLWGTTAAADGYAEGAALKPRTGDVPLSFKHLKSRISVNLATSSGADAVTLTGAKISLTSLASTATFSLHDGTVSPGTQNVIIWNESPVDGEFKVQNYMAVPQTIPDTARLVVKLSDGTTYSLQLNQCVDGSSAAVASWDSNKSYTYTITVVKEAISFRALVQDWVETTGSGNANLEWD